MHHVCTSTLAHIYEYIFLQVGFYYVSLDSFSLNSIQSHLGACGLQASLSLALGACSGLAALVGTCVSHGTAPQEKMCHLSVLIGFGTRHEFWNESTTSTEVPLCVTNIFLTVHRC